MEGTILAAEVAELVELVQTEAGDHQEEEEQDTPLLFLEQVTYTLLVEEEVLIHQIILMDLILVGTELEATERIIIQIIMQDQELKELWL